MTPTTHGPQTIHHCAYRHASRTRNSTSPCFPSCFYPCWTPHFCLDTGTPSSSVSSAAPAWPTTPCWIPFTTARSGFLTAFLLLLRWGECWNFFCGIPIIPRPQGPRVRALLSGYPMNTPLQCPQSSGLLLLFVPRTSLEEVPPLQQSATPANLSGASRPLFPRFQYLHCYVLQHNL